MQSKSGSTFLKHWLKAALTVALWTAPAGAATTITPVNADGTALSNVVVSGSTKTFYYPSTDGTTTFANAFLDVGDPTVVPNVINTKATQFVDLSGAGATGSNMLRFTLYSDKALSATSPATVALVLGVAQSGAANTTLVPIASVNGANSCNDCQGTVIEGGETFSVAARYIPGQTIQFGIYPRDICRIVSGTTGCTSSSTADLSYSSGTASITVYAYLITISDQTSTPSPATLNLSSSNADASFVMTFSRNTPTFSCPSLVSDSSFADVYYPGDAQITVDATRFPMATGTGTSPQTGLIVLGSETAPVEGSTWRTESANTVKSQVGVSSQEAVQGFTNTTDGSDHQYQLAFMAKDASGLVAYNGCKFPTGGTGVQTSAIYGFLKENKCFIATASFASRDAAPVQLLRQFRDEVLLRSTPGTAFVEWYYGWSPSAAEWLIHHPVARVPVLMFLAPIQLIAWLFLHPGWMLSLVLLNAVLWFKFQRGITDEAV